MLGRSIAGPRPYLTFCAVCHTQVGGEQFTCKSASAAVRTHGKMPDFGRGAGNRKMQHTGNTFFVPGDNGLTVCEVFTQIVRSRQTAGESGEVLA